MARTATRLCEACGTEYLPGLGVCRSCGQVWGRPVDESRLAPPGEALSLEERRSLLQERIQRYAMQGYRVVSQTDTNAQLVKPKTFNVLAFILWFLVLIVGAVLYVLYYAAVKQDDQLYLRVDERGRVTETRGA